MNFYYKTFFSQIKPSLKNVFSLSSFSEYRVSVGVRKKNSLKVSAFKMVNNLDKLMSLEYSLDNYHRSNQDTCLVHKPVVFEGQWVESGDLLADCSASVGGELSLGQNILIGYMPWEGYNFEDAILISERLVFDDLYTSIHIEKYQVDIKDTKLGMEEITRSIPDVEEKSIRHLDITGIAKLGSWVEEGDILVGKVTPVNKKTQSNYQKLLYTILEKPVLSIRDSSLRAPKGIKAKVVGIEIFKNNKVPSSLLNKGLSKKSLLEKTKKTKSTNVKQSTKSTKNQKIEESMNLLQVKKPKLNKDLKSKISLELKQKSFFKLRSFFEIYKQSNIFHQMKNKSNISGYLNSKFINNINSCSYSGDKTIHYNFYQDYLSKEQNQTILNSKGNLNKNRLQTSFSDNSQMLIKKNSWTHLLKKTYSSKKKLLKNKNIFNPNTKNLLTSVSSIHVYLAEKRRVQVGDKMAGRHGNKGIISQILPPEDMPFLPDGTPLDMVLNPLGVPSRMNVGQLYECLLGLAGKHLGENFKVFPFDEIYGAEASRSFVYSKLNEAKIKTGKHWLFNPHSPGKARLYDGRTGETFDQSITVGYAYMIRLVHMVDDKIHARSTGPYSLVTQQPLRGRSKQGGQRLGEMEVWALEGYGAAFTLLEMLTIKSDDMSGRLTLWSNLILNNDISIGTPESFKVLMCELQALCLDINLFHVTPKKLENPTF